MSGNLIDLFFSLKGHVGRRGWLAGTLALAAAAAAGVWLFNDDSFDESLNAVRETPTMAAFLWALVSLYAFTALSAKRLRDGGSAPWLIHSLWLPAAIAISAWGLGILPDLGAGAAAALALLGAIALPAALRCATQPTSGGA